MRFETEGRGPVLLLVPGLGCDRRMWDPVARELRDRFTLVHPHLWEAESLSAAAQGFAALVEEQRAPAGVAGLSMGGYATFELLRQRPELVRAVALLDTTAYPDDSARVEKRNHVLGLIERGRFEQVLTSFVESVLAPEHASGGPLRERMEAMGRAVGPEGFARGVRAILRRGSYENVLPTIRVPTLFLGGELDELTPPAVAHRMAGEVPGSRVEVIPRAGHMSPLERPDSVAIILRHFFETALGRQS